MTEAEWMDCEDPQTMLGFLEGRVSHRKLRLFACACCRRVQQRLGVRTSATALEVAERFADGRADAAELNRAFEASLGSRSGLNGCAALADAIKAAQLAAAQGASRAAETTRVAYRHTTWQEERRAQARLLREMIQLFAPVYLAPTWLTPAVNTLAKAAHDERILPSGELEPARLAILSDALEEAGCTDADVLDHLRSAGPHVRGCWALDLILGKK